MESEHIQKPACRDPGRGAHSMWEEALGLLNLSDEMPVLLLKSLSLCYFIMAALVNYSKKMTQEK